MLTVAEMQARDLGRRRLALVLLVALPLAFYLSVPADDPFALVAGGAGMVWAISVASLFAVLGSRRAEPRLVLAGYRPAELIAGRFGLLVVGGMLLAAAASTLLTLRSAPPQPGLLVSGVALAALVAVPLGLCVAALLPRELEGTLVIVGVVGIELSLPIEGSGLAAWLPLYGPQRFIAASTGMLDAEATALLHTAGWFAGLVVIAAVVWTRRVRVVRHGR